MLYCLTHRLGLQVWRFHHVVVVVVVSDTPRNFSCILEAIVSKKQQKAKADTAEARAKKDLEDAQVELGAG